MNAVALTQELVRIKTVNPLDPERPAAERAAKLLQDAGSSRRAARASSRGAKARKARRSAWRAIWIPFLSARCRGATIRSREKSRVTGCTAADPPT